MTGKVVKHPAKPLEISAKFIHVYPTIFLTTCENAFQVVQGFFRPKTMKNQDFQPERHHQKYILSILWLLLKAAK